MAIKKVKFIAGSGPHAINCYKNCILTLLFVKYVSNCFKNSDN